MRLDVWQHRVRAYNKMADQAANIAMDIGTHRVRHRPLKTLAARSAAAMARLFDYQLLHVRRAGNQMADYLANVAMDERQTVVLDLTDSANTHVQRLHDLLRNDLTHQASHPPPHDSHSHRDQKRAQRQRPSGSGRPPADSATDQTAQNSPLDEMS
jgi:hypothetical protein